MRKIGRSLRASVLTAIFSLTGFAPQVAAQILPGGLVVKITAPTAGASVRGTVAVTASVITGSLGVAGVQFKLDGANLGAEDTGGPYSIAWNTASASDGPHTLTAVARDVLGIRYSSDPVAVSVENTAAPPAAV